MSERAVILQPTNFVYSSLLDDVVDGECDDVMSRGSQMVNKCYADAASEGEVGEGGQKRRG